MYACVCMCVRCYCIHFTLFICFNCCVGLLLCSFGYLSVYVFGLVLLYACYFFALLSLRLFLYWFTCVKMVVYLYEIMVYLCEIVVYLCEIVVYLCENCEKVVRGLLLC